MIEDERRRRWNGSSFVSPTRAAGSLYATQNVAAFDCQAILRHHFRGVEPARFIVPVIVEVFSDDPIEPAEVIHHMTKASRLYLNTKEYGNGPGESLVLATIDWGRMVKENEVPHESE